MEIREIELNKIHPNYRLVYTEDVILSLCNDIRCNGMREPVVVELVEYWFEIVDGEKRWRACKRIGLSKIRSIILESSII